MSADALRSRIGQMVVALGAGAVLALGGSVASAGAAQASSWAVDHQTTMQGRTVKLWMYGDALQWHAQILGGSAGDVVKLEWSDDGFKTYQFWGATIPSGASSVNTRDESGLGILWKLRACGFVGSHSGCTAEGGW